MEPNDTTQPEGVPPVDEASPPAGAGATPEPSGEPTMPYVGQPSGEPTLPSLGQPSGEPTMPYVGQPSGEPTMPYVGQPSGEPTMPWSPAPAPGGYGGWVPPGAGWVPPGTGWGWSPPPHTPSTPPRSHRPALLAGVVAAALVVLLVGAGVAGYAVHDPGTTNVSTSTPSRGAFTGATRTTSTGSTSRSGGSVSSSAGSPSNVSAIASGVDPDLVDINTTLKAQNEQAAGTGMVLTASGEILTNNHVIEGATTISATDIGNGKTYSATVVGYDRTDDVAVLQLQGASGLKTVSIGNSSNASTGEGVVGIGNAGGAGGTPSAAGGSITALNQAITASDAGDGTSETLTGLIETNAGIEPGDSGGPLVTTSGQVIGMDTAASSANGGGGGFSFRAPSGSTNQAYAIPINQAITLAKKIEGGSGSATVHIGKTAFLGVEVSPTGSSPATTGRLGGLGGLATTTTGSTGTSTTSGAHIAGTVTGTPATQAGLAKGDVITSLGGKPVTSANSLSGVIGAYHPGDKVKVTWVTSAGQQQSATITLASGPAA